MRNPDESDELRGSIRLELRERAQPTAELIERFAGALGVDRWGLSSKYHRRNRAHRSLPEMHPDVPDSPSVGSPNGAQNQNIFVETA